MVVGHNESIELIRKEGQELNFNAIALMLFDASKLRFRSEQDTKILVYLYIAGRIVDIDTIAHNISLSPLSMPSNLRKLSKQGYIKEYKTDRIYYSISKKGVEQLTSTIINARIHINQLQKEFTQKK